MIDRKIILASNSPRRKELLAQIGLKFEIIPSNEPEVIVPGISIEEGVMNIASQKVSSIAKRQQGDYLIIGADTVVYCHKVFGKPKDEEDATLMLEYLSGKVHQVITGLCVMDTRNSMIKTSYEVTNVKMRDLRRDEINSYVKTGEPMDKAGAYGIQMLGSLLVERIEGCYFNVVGLPLTNLAETLKEFGISVL